MKLRKEIIIQVIAAIGILWIAYTITWFITNKHF